MSLLGGADQAKQRRAQHLTDQHGRRWWATIEIKSGDPAGPINPQFRAPLIPPQPYLRVDSADPGQFGKVEILYDAWLTNLREAHAEWNRQKLFHANRLFGDKAAEAVENPPPALLQAIGESPQALEPVLAAQSGGDQWILGADVPKPKWAERFFVETDPAAAYAADLAFLDEGAEDEKVNPLAEYHALRRRAKDLGLDLGANPTKDELEKALAGAEEPTEPSEGVTETVGSGAVHESWSE